MVKVLSANRLSDGVVVYVGPAGGWVETLDGAALLGDVAEVEAALAAARADEALNLVVDSFAVDVVVADGHVQASTLRDRIRASGPTIAFGAAALPSWGRA